MALTDDSTERTEPATPRRRSEARGHGQIARSHDLATTITVLAALVSLQLFGLKIWGWLLAVMRTSLRCDPGPSRRLEASLIPLAASAAVDMFKMLAPLLAVLFVVAAVTMYAQIGWLITFKPLVPKLGRLNPVAGLRRLFSAHAMVHSLLSLMKLALLAAVAYFTLSAQLPQILCAADMDHRVLYGMLADMVYRLGIRLAVILLVLALIDYVYKRYRHEKDLRMTKEEVKEELRRMEGDPVIKRRRREVQVHLALQRLRSAVPKADVVVTNPTHVAVALRYDSERMNAPKVVAKGADYLALRIRQLAAAAGVPIVERKELARALYETVEVGQEIPERLYRAVAEILAYVYELTGRRVEPRAAPAA